MFVMNVGNYSGNGLLRADPIEDGKTYPSEAAALEAYTAFVARWTESQMEVDLETGEEQLVEVGNTLAPVESPKPPVPNRPTTETDDEV